MKMLWIALKDLRLLLQQRGELVSLFLLPMAFIVVLSAVTGVPGSSGSPNLTTLPVVNLDGGEAAQAYVQALADGGAVEVKLYEEAEARSLLAQGTLRRVLFVPAGFGAAIAEEHPVALRLAVHPDADSATTDSVLRVIDGVSRDMSIQTQLAASLAHIAKMQATAPGASDAFAPEKVEAQVSSQMERAKTSPLVTIEEVEPSYRGKLAAERAEPKATNTVQIYIPGYTVLFVFIAAQTTASSIFDEKKQGSLRRLMAAPMSRAELLLGKMLPNLITALVQIIVIFGIGAVVFPWIGLPALSLGSDPLALVILSLVLALCSTSLGLVIAALAHTQGQIGGIGSLVLYTAGAAGGCLLPTFLFAGIPIVPHYWAVQAYQAILIRGRGLADISLNLVVLLGFAAVMFAIGVWRFEWD